MVATFDIHDNVGTLAGSINELILRRLSACFKKADIPLTAYQYQLMTRLWNKDGIHQNQLADQLNRDRSAITHMVDQLEKKKLAERRQDKRDKRANCVFLTPTGRKLKPKAEQCASKTLRYALDGLDEEAYQSLMEALKHIKGNLVTV